MVEVWAIYDGDIEDLGEPAKPSLDTRIQDILWNMGIDASAQHAPCREGRREGSIP